MSKRAKSIAVLSAAWLFACGGNPEEGGADALTDKDAWGADAGANTSDAGAVATCPLDVVGAPAVDFTIDMALSSAVLCGANPTPQSHGILDLGLARSYFINFSVSNSSAQMIVLSKARVAVTIGEQCVPPGGRKLDQVTLLPPGSSVIDFIAIDLGGVDGAVCQCSAHRNDP